MKIKDVFHVSSGVRIVAEEAYKNKGSLPFVAAQTEREGIVRFSDENWLKTKTRNGKSVIVRQPCVTWTKNGYAGELSYRDYPFFPGDDCGVLIPRKKHVDKINMKWFTFAMQDYIKRFVTSQGTQGKLFDTQMGEIEIFLPDISEQNEMLGAFEYKHSIRCKTIALKEKIEAVLSVVPKGETSAGVITIGTGFHMEGGNSGLTEEVIYNCKSMDFQDSIRVYSATSQVNNTRWRIDKSKAKSNITLKTFKGPAVIVSRKGEAGKAQYITDAEFTANDNVYIMTLKEKFAKTIDLRWFSLICEHYAQPYISSKGSNGTLCKEFFLSCKMSIPEITEQRKIVKEYADLLRIYYKLLYVCATIDRDLEGMETYKSLITKTKKDKGAGKHDA